MKTIKYKQWVRVKNKKSGKVFSGEIIKETNFLWFLDDNNGTVANYPKRYYNLVSIHTGNPDSKPMEDNEVMDRAEILTRKGVLHYFNKLIKIMVSSKNLFVLGR